MRRTLLIAAAAIVFLGLAVAVYLYFFRAQPPIEIAPGTSGLPSAGEQTPPSQVLTGDSSDTPPEAPTIVQARLVQIAKGPIVPGMIALSKKPLSASSTPEVAVQYIERASGNIYTYHTGTKTITRISNRTVPGIQSAHWVPSGSTAFVRYLSGPDYSTINTYGLPLEGGEGFFLPQNLADVAVSSSTILTLSSGVNGSTATLLRTDGTRPATLFTSPLSSLRVSFAGKSQYLATTKSSGTVPGSAFLVSATGRFSRIAGPQEGLVALASHSGKWVLVTYAAQGSLQTELVNIATAEKIPVPVGTIADKCVWAPDDSSIYCGVPVTPPAALYPDDWYQGVAHFSDRIWKIQVDGRYAQLILDFSKEAQVSLDLQAPALDPLQTTLVFMNKNDGSLWSYSL